METSETFTFSEAEARKMRVGAFLPLFLILPIAASFGLDSSKHQPSHFLITFGIGVAFAVLFVSMARAGVRGRIDQLSNTIISITDQEIVWQFATGQTELLLEKISEVIVQKRWGAVRSIVLKRADGKQSRIEGYNRMEALVECLRKNLSSPTFTTKKWMHI
jgi:hypothetical protein